VQGNINFLGAIFRTNGSFYFSLWTIKYLNVIFLLSIDY